MDKESTYLLQHIDANCNDCKHMKRDLAKFNSYNELYGNTNPSHRIHYGDCLKFDKPVSFIPNTCQLETQHCFEHRKDSSHVDIEVSFDLYLIPNKSDGEKAVLRFEKDGSNK